MNFELICTETAKFGLQVIKVESSQLHWLSLLTKSSIPLIYRATAAKNYLVCRNTAQLVKLKVRVLQLLNV